MTQLGPKITQKSIKIEMDASENLKIAKKHSFLTLQRNVKKKRLEKTSKFSPHDLLLMPNRFEFSPPPPSNSLPQRPDGRSATERRARALSVTTTTTTTTTTATTTTTTTTTNHV